MSVPGSKGDGGVKFQTPKSKLQGSSKFQGSMVTAFSRVSSNLRSQ